MILINIYGPNRDDPEFYSKLLTDIHTYDHPVILASDFNLVLNPEQDSYDYVNVNNPNAHDQVLNLMIECNLIAV